MNDITIYGITCDNSQSRTLALCTARIYYVRLICQLAAHGILCMIIVQLRALRLNVCLYDDFVDISITAPGDPKLENMSNIQQSQTIIAIDLEWQSSNHGRRPF